MSDAPLRPEEPTVEELAEMLLEHDLEPAPVGERMADSGTYFVPKMVDPEPVVDESP